MFIGREEELAGLQELWKRPGARLVTCRGRRRIGKSTLFEEFARRCGATLIKLEGGGDAFPNHRTVLVDYQAHIDVVR